LELVERLGLDRRSYSTPSGLNKPCPSSELELLYAGHGWCRDGLTIQRWVILFSTEPATQVNSAWAIPLWVGTMSTSESWGSKQAHHMIH